MGEDDLVDGRGVDGERCPVALSQGGQSLVEPGVDEDARVRAVEEEAAPGHGAGCSQEGQGRVGHGCTSPSTITATAK